MKETMLKTFRGIKNLIVHYNIVIPIVARLSISVLNLIFVCILEIVKIFVKNYIFICILEYTRGIDFVGKKEMFYWFMLTLFLQLIHIFRLSYYGKKYQYKESFIKYLLKDNFVSFSLDLGFMVYEEEYFIEVCNSYVPHVYSIFFWALIHTSVGHSILHCFITAFVRYGLEIGIMKIVKKESYFLTFLIIHFLYDFVIFVIYKYIRPLCKDWIVRTYASKLPTNTITKENTHLYTKSTLKQLTEQNKGYRSGAICDSCHDLVIDEQDVLYHYDKFDACERCFLSSTTTKV